MAVDIGIGLFHVVAVFLDGMSQTADVIMRVVADLVPFAADAVGQGGVRAAGRS